MGFLDQYGAGDERRARVRKRIIGGILLAAILLGGGYYYFLTWREERVVKEFLATLDRRDFQGAYRMWGCTQDTPCPNYDPGRFNQDWGPDTPYSKGSAATVANVDFCGDGVVFLLRWPDVEPVSLWVDRSTKVLSFAPWERCPGRHWEFKRFFSSLFGTRNP
jgi:hypothetical protein